MRVGSEIKEEAQMPRLRTLVHWPPQPVCRLKRLTSLDRHQTLAKGQLARDPAWKALLSAVGNQSDAKAASGTTPPPASPLR